MKISNKNKKKLSMLVPIICYVVAVALQFGLFAILAEYCSDVGEIVVAWFMFALEVITLLMLFSMGNRGDTEAMFAQFEYLCSRFTDEFELANALRAKARSEYNRLIVSKVCIFVMTSVVPPLFATVIGLVSENVWIYYALPFAVILISPFFWLDLVLPSVAAIDEFALSEQDYSEFYAVAKEAAREAENCLPVKIFPDFGQGISVEIFDGYSGVFLSCEYAALLTREELKNVLLCEITSALKTNNHFDRKCGRVLRSMSTIGNVFTKRCFGFLVFNLNFWYNNLSVCQLKCGEISGLNTVRTRGNDQAYVDACAKIELYSFFGDKDLTEFNAKIFERESFPSNFFVALLDEFRRYCDEDFYSANLYLSKHIPWPSYDKLSVAQKMKRLGVDHFDYCHEQEQNDYYFERQSLLMLGCSMIAGTSEATFATSRLGFLQDKNRYESYVALKAAGTQLNLAQTVSFLGVLYYFDRDECLRVCDEILEKYPKNAYASYYKGRHLANELDGECVKLLYAACSNMGLRERALEEIGKYAGSVGDEKLLATYEYNDAIGYSRSDSYGSAHSKIALCEPFLSSKDMEELSKQIFAIAGECAEKISFASDIQFVKKLCVLIGFKNSQLDEGYFHNIARQLFAFFDAYAEENSCTTEFRMLVPGHKIPTDKLTSKLSRYPYAKTYLKK